MASEGVESILFWFSQRMNRYETSECDKTNRRKFGWTDETVVVDWDNCSLSMAGRLDNGKTRVILRSDTNRNSRYMGNKPIKLRYMLGIDIASVSEPFEEYYQPSDIREHLPDSAKTFSKRMVFRLDDQYWIWEWVKENNATGENEDSNIQKIYRYILQNLNDTAGNTSSRDLFQVNTDGGDFMDLSKMEKATGGVIPVVYQPSVDSLKNFVREIHCKEVDPHVVEVSLLFENEQLRRHKRVNRIYEYLRLFLYGRKIDVETFRIYTNPDRSDNEKYFVFERIYSGKYGLEYDTIHADPPVAPKRKAKHFFADYRCPIVFVNTSNHAMAESDSNQGLWKWEYVPFAKNAPVVFGSKSRTEIDRQFSPFVSYFCRGKFISELKIGV